MRNCREIEDVHSQYDQLYEPQLLPAYITSEQFKNITTNGVESR